MSEELKAQEELLLELASYSKDPLGFVLFAFPWGEPGTDLEDKHGPEAWQLEVLKAVGDGILSVGEAVRIAVASGHGVGKSALVAWLILWALSTFEDTRGRVTANKEEQLKTCTWAELSKWHRLFIGESLFKVTATSIFSADPAHERTWRVDAVTWSTHNTQGFAGMHNKGKRLLVVFDEASGIDDAVWEVADGSLTDTGTELIWCVFGNPTEARGRFRDCFPGGRFAHRWRHFHVDARTVSISNHKEHEKWIEDWGIDSDFVRVRVLGQFPRIDSHSFIPASLAEEAAARTVVPEPGLPVVLGVDVARFGDDFSVIYPRRGRDAVSLPVEVYQGIDTMELAVKVAEAASRYNSPFVFVDEGGVGGGVVDRLRAMGVPVVGVQFGSRPLSTDPDERGIQYHNRRASMWGAMKRWLATGAIPRTIPGMDRTLIEELSAPTYKFMQEGATLALESKQDMRRRGEKSPDVADALALTFALPVLDDIRPGGPAITGSRCPSYNPLSMERFNDVWTFF